MYSQPSKSDSRGISVNNLTDSSSVQSITGETVQLYYNNSGTLTADAGQPIGTFVMGRTANNHILNALGDSFAMVGDMSLGFTSTALTTEVTIVKSTLEMMDTMTFAERFAFLQNGFPGQSSFSQGLLTTAGQYCVDYDKGVIYGLKASTQGTLTGTSYKSPTSAIASSGGTVALAGPLPAGTNVIGHVVTDATSTTIATQATGTNLHVVTDSTSTTAVTQATASSLNAQVVGTVASGSTDSGNPVKVGGKYNASGVTLTDGQRGDLQVSVNSFLETDEQFAPGAEDNVYNLYAIALKPVATATYSWTLFQNLAANVTLNINSGSRNIKSIYCVNNNASVRYIQFFNTATTPSGGAVPVLTYLIPPLTNTVPGVILIDGQILGDDGYNLTTGLAFGFSTTSGTYTPGSAADMLILQVMFK